MKDLRTKIAVVAVIFGLGGLGGYAMASNPAGHGPVTGAHAGSQARQAAARVTTGTSGAASTPAANLSVSQALPRNAGEGGQDD
jgi:hypothetical protein